MKTSERLEKKLLSENEQNLFHIKWSTGDDFKTLIDKLYKLGEEMGSRDGDYTKEEYDYVHGLIKHIKKIWDSR